MRSRHSRFAMAVLILLSVAPVHAQPSRSLENELENAEEAEEIQARAELRRRQRLDSDGQIPYGALLRAKEQLQAKAKGSIVVEPQDAGIWSWQWLGPGNIGGRLRAILVDPTNPSVMWVGTAGGGIWRTTNGGTGIGGPGWTPVSDFLPALAVVTLAMDPTNPQRMYAGTGELEGSNASIAGAGVFKSIDGGVTWTQMPFTATPDFDFVSRLDHHPTQANELLAGTRTGVYRSVNGANTWTPILIPDFGEPVRDVKYNPSNPSVIAAGTTSDFYLSVDSGTTWHRQTTGALNKMPLHAGRCEIAFARTNSNMIAVSAGLVDDGNDLSDVIWRSMDGGTTWSPWLLTNADPWSNALWISPTNANVVVWGGFGDLRRTIDGGLSSAWISAWQGYTAGTSAHGDEHVVVPALGYNGTTNKTVFVGNDGGIQKATDITTASPNSGWTNLAHGLGITQFFGGAAAPDGSVILGGTQDNGMLVLHSGAGTEGWTNPVWGDAGYAAVDPSNPARIFCAGPWLNIARSDNGGQSFVQKTAGLTETGDKALAGFLAPLVMDPNNPAVLYAGGRHIWRTANAGDLWAQLPGLDPPSGVCTAIDVAQSSTLAIWVGFDNGLLFYSINGGTTWTPRTLPVGNRFITDIAINPYAYNEVIVTVGGYSTDTVWLTNTSGASWFQRTGAAPHDLPAIQVNTVRYHPLQPNWIYVGTDIGVFASEDKGVSWRITPAYGGNDGPNNAEVDELFWQGTSYLMAATHGRGMYRCKPLPIVYVDQSYVGLEDGSEFRPYNTVTEAVATYGPGALVSIKMATYTEAAITIGKRGTVRATNGKVIIR
jgi:hypothetical protein